MVSKNTTGDTSSLEKKWEVVKVRFDGLEGAVVGWKAQLVGRRSWLEGVGGLRSIGFA